jgi:hypothetical protein
MYWNTFGTITKNKSWEFEIGRFPEWNWFDFKLKLTRKEDHAGLYKYVEILGFFISFQIYDNRHWNYEKDRWYLPGEEIEEWELTKKYE